MYDLALRVNYSMSLYFSQLLLSVPIKSVISVISHCCFLPSTPQEEIFVPITHVMKVCSLTQAIAINNDVPQVLSFQVSLFLLHVTSACFFCMLLLRDDSACYFCCFHYSCCYVFVFLRNDLKLGYSQGLTSALFTRDMRSVFQWIGPSGRCNKPLSIPLKPAHHPPLCFRLFVTFYLSKLYVPMLTQL